MAVLKGPLAVFMWLALVEGVIWFSGQPTSCCGQEDSAAYLTTDEQRIARWFYNGRLAGATEEATAFADTHPEDHDAIFQLGVLKFFRAVERFGQAQFRYGLAARNAILIPFVRMPVPQNDHPDELSYEDARDILSQFVQDLDEAENVLSRVGDHDVKFRLDLMRVKLDLNLDGASDEAESLWSVFAAVNPQAARNTPAKATVALDGGDVEWLRGYCHLLQALGQFVLAHDFHTLHEHCAHLFYPRATSPYSSFLQHEATGRNWSTIDIADLIALIHLIDFEVKEPERLRSVLEHLQAMIDRSRASWEKILAETDDDSEWLPGPSQHAALTSVRVTGPMVDSWQTFLDEAEALLAGDKLIPFWRASRQDIEAGRAYGVNLHRIFTEPTRFDLVLWVQGTAAVPYLEEGELTDRDVWAQLMQAFRGQFWGFALWFN